VWADATGTVVPGVVGNPGQASLTYFVGSDGGAIAWNLDPASAAVSEVYDFGEVYFQNSDCSGIAYVDGVDLDFPAGVAIAAQTVTGNTYWAVPNAGVPTSLNVAVNGHSVSGTACVALTQTLSLAPLANFTALTLPTAPTASPPLHPVYEP
jgi:hypothetical protein